MKSSEYIKPSAEEIAKIKQEDRATINKYFMLNYNLIRCTAKRYCIAVGMPSFDNMWEDMVHEIYLAFPKLNFQEYKTFVYTCKTICKFTRVGGVKIYYQMYQGNTKILNLLDAPISKYDKYDNDFNSILDTLESDFNIFKVTEENNDDNWEMIFAYLCEFLTPKLKEAFFYYFFTDLSESGVAREMKVANGTASNHKHNIKMRIRLHEKDFKEFLHANNIYKLDYLFRGEKNGN